MSEIFSNLEIRIHEATNYLEACQSFLSDNSFEQWQTILNLFASSKLKIKEKLDSDSNFKKQINLVERELNSFINRLISIKHQKIWTKAKKLENVEQAVTKINTEFQNFLLLLGNEISDTEDFFLEAIQADLLGNVDRCRSLLENSFRAGNKWAGLKLAQMCQNLDNAEFYLREIIDPRALYAMGNLKLSKGLIDEAVAYWTKSSQELGKTSNYYEKLALDVNLKLIQYGNMNSDLILTTLNDNIQKFHAESINYLGYLYYNGGLVVKDLNQSFKLFRKAAELGHSDSYNNLGICFEKGHGTEISIEKAKEAYFAIAESHGEACSNLGFLLYKEGKFRESLHYLSRGSFLGSTTAETLLIKVLTSIAMDKTKLDELTLPFKNLQITRSSENKVIAP
eukprot:NODE_221_length_12388_cov_2.350883.p4 type:complete len:396 gc:universal NODE_221_length_12388_cov_2.350883:710-1897(+)